MFVAFTGLARPHRRIAAALYGHAWRCGAVLSVALLFGCVAAHGAPAFDPPRFVSPDGTRAVRLYLVRIESRDAKYPLPNTGARLWIEYSMLSGQNEIIVRRFTARRAGVDGAGYRVLWDAQSAKFVVLSDARSKADDGPFTDEWPTGESVLFFHDRESGLSPPELRYRPEKWAPSALRGPARGVELPLLSADLSTPGAVQTIGKTGQILRPKLKPPGAERIANFTIHSNTQNLGTDNSRPLFSMPPVALTTPSPNGKVTARVFAGGNTPAGRYPIVALAEGDRFRDQLWVLHLRMQSAGPAWQGYRFAWSKDSRYLLFLTRGSGEKGLATIDSGEELFLLFDTARWEGILQPEPDAIAKLGFTL